MSTAPPYWLDPLDSRYLFPDPRLALRDPDGLLAVGGDLAPGRLLAAYRQGIFPWYSAGQPILWWSPDPRAVLLPKDLKLSRSLRRTLRKRVFRVTVDAAFDEVIRACAEPRKDGAGTWITDEMQAAYGELHRLGHAHSVESWYGEELVGGLYGVVLGRAFFGESMFSRRADASKAAFVHLVRQLQDWGFGLIDCQVSSAHLASLGAVDIRRDRFLGLLERYCRPPHPAHHWPRTLEAPDL